jgi:hypothetical protein
VAAACARAVALTYMVASSLNDVGRLVASVPLHPEVGVAGSERCRARRIAGGGVIESPGRLLFLGRKDTRREREELMPSATRCQGQR